jgi:pimeloyl-ACP methyl ester carboxylesterase
MPASPDDILRADPCLRGPEGKRDDRVMLGSVFYLDGDSFDRRSRIERSLRQRLKFRHWTGQLDLIAYAGDEKLNTDISARLTVLERLVSAGDRTGPKVVMARSSGARVASLLAAGGAAISALVCFGYPFRNPKGPVEPVRYSHLARIATPTLILQGMSDVYGGLEITRNYELSDAVTVRFVDCGHDFSVSEDEWDRIADLVGRFCLPHACPVTV